LTLETAVREALEKGEVLVPAIPVTSCPIAASLEVLGKKWTLEILRDIGMRKNERFSQLLESVQGICPRLLSRRLRELEASGLVRRIEEPATPKKVVWKFTEKGWDTLPILMSYVAFGSKYFPERVFTDGQPREGDERDVSGPHRGEVLRASERGLAEGGARASREGGRRGERPARRELVGLNYLS
jgi:DNA-binding HxlR family transcriptional regulator